MPVSLVILGASPSAGKSVLAVGILRGLANRGIRVAPFKAVSVLTEERTSSEGVRLPERGIPHHCRAARTPFTMDMNPIVIAPRDRTKGQLYIRGRPAGVVDYAHEDMLVEAALDPTTRSSLREVAQDSLSSLLDSYDVVICEGAASPVDFSEIEDIANVFMARQSDAPIVLCARSSRGGSAAAIVGTGLLLPEDLRSRLLGFVLGDVDDNTPLARSDELVQRHLGLERLGIVPHLDIWDRPREEHPHDEAAYDLWCEAVETHVSSDLWKIASLG